MGRGRTGERSNIRKHVKINFCRAFDHSSPGENTKTRQKKEKAPLLGLLNLCYTLLIGVHLLPVKSAFSNLYFQSYYLNSSKKKYPFSLWEIAVWENLERGLKRCATCVSLFFQGTPRPLHQVKENVTSSKYVPVTLIFTVIAYPEPGPTGFTWHKEVGTRWTPLLSNADIHISSTGLQTNLTIMNVSQSDYGQYRITTVNSIGTFEQYLFLTGDFIHLRICFFFAF